MGGSEWCIMLFSDALAHCDSDPNCGGYTMTSADWFHTKYDKRGQLAVHLTKAGQKILSVQLLNGVVMKNKKKFVILL
jgi:hypothetical protein